VENLCTNCKDKNFALPLEAKQNIGYDTSLIAPFLPSGVFLVNRTFALLALTLGLLAPLCAQAATVAAATLPDGTYTVKVEKIIDPKHVQVQMDNGNDVTLVAGRASVDFSKLQPNDQIKLSLISGTVMVYLDLTSH
jgi:hypothetical protein